MRSTISNPDWVKLKQTDEYLFKVSFTPLELTLLVESERTSKTLTTKITNQNISEELKEIFINIENLYTFIQSESNYRVMVGEKKIMVVVKIEMPFTNIK